MTLEANPKIAGWPGAQTYQVVTRTVFWQLQQRTGWDYDIEGFPSAVRNFTSILLSRYFIIAAVLSLGTACTIMFRNRVLISTLLLDVRYHQLAIVHIRFKYSRMYSPTQSTVS